MPPRDLPSTSIDFSWENFHQLPSILQSARRPSINLSQLSVWLGDLLSTFVKFPYNQEIVHQRPSTFHAAVRQSVKFACGKEISVNFLQHSLHRETVRYLTSNFRATGRPFVNLCPISVPPGDLPSILVNLSCSLEIFRQILSTFRATRRPSINQSINQHVKHAT